MSALRFEVLANDSGSAARVGRLRLAQAELETPVFMPVGTQASVKSQTPGDVMATGSQLILANTYHLMLRPSAELVHELGGVQRFMAWPHAILTDSGGYQVFSLADLRKLDDDGVVFRSHIDGSPRALSPERSMDVQRLLGSDIAMVLDECPPGDADRPTVQRAVDRTSRWAERCLASERAPGQARFGIVQGGSYLDMRLAHLETIASMPFEGLALGGFSVGEAMSVTYELLTELGPRMPTDRPRYLMGVGKPIDLLRAIGSGIDMFDCVLPTRNARNGQALTWNGRVNLKQSRHRRDPSPIDPECKCATCTTFSRAYLRHLITAAEMLGPRLITQHNLHFYQDLTRAAREAIREGRYAQWAAEAEARMLANDEVKTDR
ncbi:MAG TPA: tRNA guanosine(34) transglycosylase Tgt [Polyangiales bacterium]|nr:tRNA guanosine(34) transglycosylase Tgt [Polyangiales bacterium]